MSIQKKLDALSTKAKDVLGLIYQGKSKDEIKEELGIKGLAYATATKKIIKDGLVEDADLGLIDEVAELLDAPEEKPKKKKKAKKSEEEPVKEKKSKKKGKKKAEKEPEEEEEEEEEVSEEEIFEELTKLFETEQPIETLDDIKDIVQQKGFLDVDDKKGMSAPALVLVEKVAAKAKTRLPWQVEEKTKKAKKTKKASGDKPKKAKKSVVPTSELGSRENSQAFEIDECILGKKKMTVAEIADKLDIGKARVNLHVNFLRKNRGFDIASDKNGKLSYSK